MHRWRRVRRSALTGFVVVGTGVSVSSGAAGQAVDAVRNEYHLTFGRLSDRVIHVEARLRLRSDSLVTDGFPIWFAPEIDSWWQLIEVDRLEADDGRPVRIIGTSGHRARLSRRVEGTLSLTYRVDFGFIDTDLRSVNTPGGAGFDDGLFVVGKSVFVLTHPRDPVSVRVTHPDDLFFSAPWEWEDGRYVAEGGWLLTWTNLVLSREAPVRVADSALDYRLAPLGLSDSTVAEMEAFARVVTGYYRERFPPARSRRYLQVAFATEGPEYGGEGYLEGSASSVVENDPQGRGWAWRAVFAHELFHKWNSHSLNIPLPSGNRMVRRGRLGVHNLRHVARDRSDFAYDLRRTACRRPPAFWDLLPGHESPGEHVRGGLEQRRPL